MERKNRLILAAALTSLGLFLIGFAFGQAAPPLEQTHTSPSSRSQICAAQRGQAAPNSRFSKDATAQGMAELQLGELQQRASHQEVGDFRTSMVENHAKANDPQRAYDQFLTVGAMPTNKNGNRTQ